MTAGSPSWLADVRGELQAGSQLSLDMVDDARVLYDRDGVFAAAREGWRERLARLGGRRIWRGNALGGSTFT